jgi:hypothetical protein
MGFTTVMGKVGTMADIKSRDWQRQEKTVSDTGSWRNKFDWVEEFHASPHGENVAAKAEKNGELHGVVNGKPINRPCDVAWAPIFSPDGMSVLVRSIEQGKYIRRVVPVKDIIG